MKEQNNREGTVDKTSLKCKGVIQILFLLNVTSVAPRLTRPPPTFAPDTFHRPPSSPHHTFMLPSLPGTHVVSDPRPASTKWKDFIGSDASWVSQPLISIWEIWDQLSVQKWPIIKHPANTFYRNSSRNRGDELNRNKRLMLRRLFGIKPA